MMRLTNISDTEAIAKLVRMTTAVNLDICSISFCNLYVLMQYSTMLLT
jgi:hypothetical protein